MTNLFFLQFKVAAFLENNLCFIHGNMARHRMGIATTKLPEPRVVCRTS